MEKIKEIGLRVFDWGKKHKVLSIFLCITILTYTIKGCVWIYNDIAYGRFVRVGEKHIDDTWHSNIYETDYSAIHFFIPSNSYTGNNASTKMIAKKLGDTPVSYLPNEIYNINGDFIYFKKAKDGFLYNLDEKNKELRFVRDISKFNSQNIKPAISIYSKDENRIINVGNKTTILKNTDKTGKIIKLDNKNILLFFNEMYNGSAFKYSYRYSLKDEKLYQLNTSEIPYLSGLHNKLIYLGNNKFLFLQGTAFDKLTNTMLFTLENDKFIKQKLKMPRNNPLFGFSTNNPLVLNKNQVLFVGGLKGELDISWRTKQCFLYDIKRNKIVKINDFPFRLRKIIDLKTKNGEFYIPVVHLQNNHTKHFIYKYKKGRFILQ